jgi:hypothetical protein
MIGAPFPRHSHLRLVPPEPQPRRRLAVRINVLDRRQAFGRAGPFRLTESDVNELIAVALRLEARQA